MATLTYTATNNVWNWTGTVNINYTITYDATTNQTTVTFLESSHSYFGRSNYVSSGTTTITVQADDNISSSGIATMEIVGATDGGIRTFSGAPSPTSITVQHSSLYGDKTVTISASTTITAYMASNTTTLSEGTGSGEISVIAGTKEIDGLIYIDDGSSFVAYQIYIDNGTSWDLYVPYIDNGSNWDLYS